MLAPLFQPDLSATYLSALAVPLAETLMLTLAAMALAIPGGIAIGLIAAMGGRLGALFASGMTLLRAVPELTLAIICVIFFGLGAGAALVAIALYYLACTGKVFGEMLEQARGHSAVLALQRTGAGGLPLALWGLLPVSSSQMLAYGAFAFECALRASIMVGAVGAGGLGGELVSVLASFDLERASTCIIATIALVLVLEAAAGWLVRKPRLLWPLFLAGLAYALYLGPWFVSPEHGLRVLGDMLPPRFLAEDWQRLPLLLGETLAMALGATLLAALLALPLGFAASRYTAPAPLRIITRPLAAALRAVPEIIWGLVLILLVGIGPIAGMAALLLHSLGSLVRLYADAMDTAPLPPRRQIARSGTSALLASLYGALPQAARPMLIHTAFRLEWNMRMATILGVIGAGGVGQALYEAQQLFFYDRMLGWLIVTALLLLTVEWLARCLPGRGRIGGREWESNPPRSG